MSIYVLHMSSDKGSKGLACLVRTLRANTSEQITMGRASKAVKHCDPVYARGTTKKILLLLF